MHHGPKCRSQTSQTREDIENCEELQRKNTFREIKLKENRNLRIDKLRYHLYPVLFVDIHQRLPPDDLDIE